MNKDESFKYGDLIIRCDQCGATETLETMVTDGRAIYLFNNKESPLTLRCTKCNVSMTMCIVPVEVTDLDEELKETNDEKLQEETAPAETV